MANLKELRTKIGVIESTKKVTSAMKLVAGVKLKKSEQKTLHSKKYANYLATIIDNLQKNIQEPHEYPMLQGRKNPQTTMLVIFSSDKGLCGNFNYLILQKSLSVIKSIKESRKNLKILCIGSKILDLLRKHISTTDIQLVDDFYKQDFLKSSEKLSNHIIELFSSLQIDEVKVIYTKFFSAINRVVEEKSIIPMVNQISESSDSSNSDCSIPYTIIEPNFDVILNGVIPYNINVQIYQCAMENFTCEQSSRMTSMDSATRNAEDLLLNLSVKYNRTRQYMITQELIEVISGANTIAEG